MELYYKDLISEDASLEKLVDNLVLVVQGAEEYAQATGAHLASDQHQALRSRLEKLKDGLNQLKGHAVAGTAATDKMLRRYPYASIGCALALGLATATVFCRWRSRD